MTQNELIHIIDDEPIIHEVLGDLLTTEGYRVESSLNGEEALEKYSPDASDLILLDLLMPGMNGFEVCSELKKLPETKETPVIFLTAKTELEDVIKGFSLGAVDYITKPFNSAELLARVHTQMELKKTREREKELADRLAEARSEIERLNTLLSNRQEKISKPSAV